MKGDLLSLGVFSNTLKSLSVLPIVVANCDAMKQIGIWPSVGSVLFVVPSKGEASFEVIVNSSFGFEKTL
jgi:hypothetical protein